MFRRRRPPPAASEAPAPVAGPSASELTEAGWALPRGIGVTTPRWTLVGTVDSPLATPVDPAGLVVGDGWSLDWWIGADDRWHVPAREAAVRQDVLDDARQLEAFGFVREHGRARANLRVVIELVRQPGDVRVKPRAPWNSESVVHWLGLPKG